ncbi:MULTISPECIES: TauD/TfdA family dioxygenase [unclassified Streptomyces]|uniref:TauD/TfdA family dioxygenase n=1 Tax=unclassified Streptomyces TaxID=2593676 RepID=UPI002E351329|nr:TauD/TfdA family dioxygenase [Streptomyces sp. NBC_01358]
MRPGDLFAAHFLDHRAPGASAQIAEQLREDGLVTLDQLATRNDVLAFSSRIMTMSAHRDSDSDGLTTIRCIPRHAGRPGYAGLGNGELAPHTERSGLPHPPRLMLLVCSQPAESGGECLLSDGLRVHADLLEHQAGEAADVLARPRTAYFGAGDGHPTQVFTPHLDGRVSLRLRLDALARWSPLVLPHLFELQAATLRHQQPVRLVPGQAYLLDNERWLHARTGFDGNRVHLRGLGDPHFVLPHGFMPALPPVSRPTAHPEALSWA